MHINGLEIIFGAAGIGFDSQPPVTEWLAALKRHGITTIDSAEVYPNSESLLGGSSASQTFTIDTKNSSGLNPTPTTASLLTTALSASLERLKTSSIDTYYLHSPDHRVAPADILRALDTLHKEGKFRRFGISNFHPPDVDALLAASKEHGLIAPSVFQGNYSAIARRGEAELLPILRKHGIAFRAYSPIAGGFLARPPALVDGDKDGRFNGPFGPLYTTMYKREPFLGALEEWVSIAESEGVGLAEMAYRWVVWHSALKGEFGDGVVVGARTLAQLDETVAAMKKGPLSDGAAARIEGVWERVKGEAYLDNWEAIRALQKDGKDPAAELEKRGAIAKKQGA